MNVTPSLKQTVSITAVSTMGDGGIPSYGTPASVACRIDRKAEMVRSAEGQETKGSARIIVGPSQTVNVTDRVTMPDGSYREVISVAPLYDLKGTLIAKEVTV